MELTVLAGLIASVELPGKLVLRVLGALAPGAGAGGGGAGADARRTGRRNGWRLVRLLLLNTLVAISIGLLVANVVQPGRWTRGRSRRRCDRQRRQANPLTQFLDNVPKSLLGPLGDDGRVLSVIFLALAFGIALRRLKHEPIGNVDELTPVAFDALVIVLHWVLEVIPLAVFGIVTAIIAQGKYHELVGLGAFVLAVILALLLQAAYYLMRVRLGSWVRPRDLMRGTRDALVMAFSTGSSTATMPVTYACLKDRVGLREQSASMGAWSARTSITTAPPSTRRWRRCLSPRRWASIFRLDQQLIVVLTSIVASVGAAGIPEAGS